MHLALKKGTKISIILVNLEEFLVISLFHETKIPMVDMKVQVNSKFRKKKLKKKWNLEWVESPWGLEHLTLPSVGARFKKSGCCTSKALAHSQNFQK
jgi:hypothetical protein